MVDEDMYLFTILLAGIVVIAIVILNQNNT